MNDFINYWNSKPRLPKAIKLTDSRKQKLTTRLKEPTFAASWRRIIDKINDSDFMTGGGSRKWKCTIDWILQNETRYMRVLEGEFVNKHITKIETNDSDELTTGNVLAYLIGFYPGSRKFTDIYINDLVGRLRHQRWNFGHFRYALSRYQNDFLTLEKGKIDTPPAVQQLLLHGS